MPIWQSTWQPRFFCFAYANIEQLNAIQKLYEIKPYRQGLINKKLTYRRQTARRICAICNGVANAIKNPPRVCVTTPNLVILGRTLSA